ncbi:serine/arginine-rich splicing factor 5 isoform X2 [Maniola hyperantus]|uniref:serine/arginine-rich splicing factor 5 isoform X2 n=1 Tax=Aphantopus hyperantus TaxID=2795564 RepID=UPI001568A050|nr:serine/arginine-rich splicing factor 5 isoform X2 [Maniola hyperantus]
MVGSRVYVGGLPFGVRERDLEKFFKGFGRIRDILIKNGYGFVEFEDYRDADDAVYELNGKELLGERVVVEPARGIDRSADRHRRDRYYERDRGRSRYDSVSRPHPSHRASPSGNDSVKRYGPPTRTEYRLIVENLSSRISWQDLKDYMRQAGEVTYADAHKQHRNEGVVEFATHTDMRAAIEKLDGTELNGRRIRLVEDRRSSRRRTRSSSSRSRSRSRERRRSSRSRSKSRPKSKSPAAKSRSRSRSKDRSRSRSPSPRKSERRSASRTSRARSPRKSQDKNGRSTDSRSKSRSPKHDSKATAAKAARERSRSRSKDAGSPKREASKERRGASKSRSRSRSRSGSRDRSGSRERSRSGSPRQNGDTQDRGGSTDRSPRSGD